MLAGQEILCWLNPTELAVVALGAGADDASALAARLQGWLARRGRQAGQTLTLRVATASYPAEGATIDDLLENLGRSLGRTDEGAPQQAVG